MNALKLTGLNVCVYWWQMSEDENLPKLLLDINAVEVDNIYTETSRACG